jgi:hypothetical protein
VPRSTTSGSTRPLSEVARELCLPAGIETTAFSRVRQKLGELGVALDAWQEGIGRVALGKRANGKYACTVGGVVLSIPRQVGKTFLVGMIMIAMCLIYPGYTVLWTAHRTRTTSKTFATMQGYVRRKKVAPHVLSVRTTNGEQEIRFRNGSVIMFGAREQGFGRGFDRVDAEVFDEAQILTAKALEDMVPATNASTHPAGGLLWFMGTPPRPQDPGEEFTARRTKALSGKSPDMLYVEIGADPNTGKPGGPLVTDRRQWAKANPSFPERTSIESMQRMLENLTEPGSVLREMFGIWDEVEQLTPAIDPFAWRDLRVESAPVDGVRSFAVVFSRDGTSVSLSGAMRHEGGVHVETIARRPLTEGTYWLAEWLTARHERAAQIAVFGKAGSTALINELRRAKVPARVLIIATQDNAITAATMLRESVRRGSVSHLADPDVLDASVVGSREHKSGTSGGWVFVPKTDEDDSTPVESVALAHWAAMTSKRRPGRKTRGRVMA